MIESENDSKLKVLSLENEIKKMHSEIEVAEEFG
jgi:hypothetical protein